MQTRFSDHDKKLWSDMADLCDRFISGKVSLRVLVSGLEGLLEASECGDKELRDRWYALWLPLEIRAATGEIEWSQDAAEEAEALRSFIYGTLRPDAPPGV